MTDTTTTTAGSNGEEVKACAAFGCNHAATAAGLCAGCHAKYRSRYWRMERLLRRAEKLAWQIDQEAFAEYLVARGYDSNSAEADFVGQWFDDVWWYMKKLRPAKDGPMCAECGQECDRLNSRYCSSRCRQKAYRKRVTDKASPRPANRNGVTDQPEGLSCEP
jgi:hypothetical protein